MRTTVSLVIGVSRRYALAQLKMISFPSSRRFLWPAICLLVMVLMIRIFTHDESLSTDAIVTYTLRSQVQYGVEIPIEPGLLLSSGNSSEQYYSSPRRECYFTTPRSDHKALEFLSLTSLVTCSIRANPYTNHIRLRNIVLNISHSTPDSVDSDRTQKFNPTILALPPWSPNHYLLVSRVVTEGLHQESLICEANMCHAPNSSSSSSSSAESTTCTAEDLIQLGPAGGLRCAYPPQILRVPPTPALRCTGAWSAFPDIPGFHDPRIFWSGKGEPLIIVNSASTYACLGLWVVDLRTLHPPLDDLLLSSSSSRKKKQKAVGKRGLLMSYPVLTELTRNPAHTRASVEKNWFLFFAGERGEEAFLHYDMVAHDSAGGGRTFAKLIGNGFATGNLTDPFEAPCLQDEGLDGRGRRGHWHQASNALRLVLCSRAEARSGVCDEWEQGRTVNFAVMHRKFSNEWDLPLRYERYFVVWDARAPFHVLAVSRFPVLFWNETASGWNGEENWAVEMEGEQKDGWKGWNETARRNTRANKTAIEHDRWSENVGENWAYFTYTPSIAWAWRSRADGWRREDRGEDDGPDIDKDYLRSLDSGYLDDKVVLGIGVDDTAQTFAMARAETLLSCLRVCSGKGTEGKNGGNSTLHTEEKG